MRARQLQRRSSSTLPDAVSRRPHIRLTAEFAHRHRVGDTVDERQRASIGTIGRHAERRNVCALVALLPKSLEPKLDDLARVAQLNSPLARRRRRAARSTLVGEVAGCVEGVEAAGDRRLLVATLAAPAVFTLAVGRRRAAVAHADAMEAAGGLLSAGVDQLALLAAIADRTRALCAVD